MTDKKTRIVACPNCKKDSIFGEQNPYRPFCSQRCHLIDLGLWANEEFKIATPLDPNLLDDDFKSH